MGAQGLDAVSGTVVTVGSVNVDATVFSDRAPAPGETIIGSGFQLGLGGKGANQAVAVARAGAESIFVASIGRDAFGALAKRQLEAHGVDLEHVREGDRETGVAHIRVSGGENTIVIVEGANGLLGTDDVDVALAASQGATVLLTQLEVPLEVTRHSVIQAHQRGIRVVLDPAPARELPDDVWVHVDVVTPNETEAALLTGQEVSGEAGARAAADWFLSRGTRAVVLTRGGAGSLVVDADGARQIAALTVDAVDSTAAGDTFAGYLGAALAAGSALDDAVRLASVAGGISVTRRGASESIPSADEVRRVVAAESASQGSS